MPPTAGRLTRTQRHSRGAWNPTPRRRAAGKAGSREVALPGRTGWNPCPSCVGQIKLPLLPPGLRAGQRLEGAGSANGGSIAHGGKRLPRSEPLQASSFCFHGALGSAPREAGAVTLRRDRSLSLANAPATGSPITVEAQREGKAGAGPATGVCVTRQGSGWHREPRHSVSVAPPGCELPLARSRSHRSSLPARLRFRGVKEFLNDTGICTNLDKKRTPRPPVSSPSIKTRQDGG